VFYDARGPRRKPCPPGAGGLWRTAWLQSRVRRAYGVKHRASEAGASMDGRRVLVCGSQHISSACHAFGGNPAFSTPIQSKESCAHKHIRRSHPGWQTSLWQE